MAALDGEPRRVAFGEQHRYLRPHWSADASSIYAVRTSAHGTWGQEAVRIPVDGGPAEVLAGLGRDVVDVRDPGNGHLYWGEVSGHAIRLLRAPLANLQQSERLPVPLVSQFQLAFGRLVFTQPQMSSLTTCALATLACEPLALQVPPEDTYHWALGARAIFLRSVQTGAAKLARYDLATRRISHTWDAAPSGAGASIAVSPDEKVLLVSREEGPAIDLMIARP